MEMKKEKKERPQSLNFSFTSFEIDKCFGIRSSFCLMQTLYFINRTIAPIFCWPCRAIQCSPIQMCSFPFTSVSEQSTHKKMRQLTIINKKIKPKLKNNEVLLRFYEDKSPWCRQWKVSNQCSNSVKRKHWVTKKTILRRAWLSPLVDWHTTTRELVPPKHASLQHLKFQRAYRLKSPEATVTRQRKVFLTSWPPQLIHMLRNHWKLLPQTFLNHFPLTSL